MFNPFARKQQPEKPEKPKRRIAAGKEEPEAGPKVAETEVPKGERRIVGIVLIPHVTEKGMALAAGNWYVFRVPQGTNKFLVKQAVEDRYRVGVEKVRMLPKRAKRVRIGRREGMTPGFKKAMVKVKAGQRIEFS